jgi:hypothetical protein
LAANGPACSEDHRCFVLEQQRSFFFFTQAESPFDDVSICAHGARQALGLPSERRAFLPLHPNDE